MARSDQYILANILRFGEDDGVRYDDVPPGGRSLDNFPAYLAARFYVPWVVLEQEERRLRDRLALPNAAILGEDVDAADDAPLIKILAITQFGAIALYRSRWDSQGLQIIETLNSRCVLADATIVADHRPWFVRSHQPRRQHTDVGCGHHYVAVLISTVHITGGIHGDDSLSVAFQHKLLWMGFSGQQIRHFIFSVDCDWCLSVTTPCADAATSNRFPPYCLPFAWLDGGVGRVM